MATPRFAKRQIILHRGRRPYMALSGGVLAGDECGRYWGDSRHSDRAFKTTHDPMRTDGKTPATARTL